MLTRTFAIARREWLHIIRSRQMRFVIFIIPVLYSIFLGFIYYHGKVTDLPLAIYDPDQTALSRELISNLRSSETFGEVYFAESFNDAEQLISRGTCKVAVIIPEDFELRVTKGGGAELLAIADGSNIIYSNTGLTSAGEVIKMFSAGTGLKLMLKEKILPDQGINILSAIQFREQPLNNPAYNYGYFLAFGILITFWHIAAAMGVAPSIVREAESDTWQQYFLSPLTRGEIICGKTIPYYCIFFLEIILIYWFGAMMLHLPLRGNALALIILTAVFLLAIMGLGILCSVIGDTTLNATRYPMLVVLPAFVLSGYTWPLAAMPELIRDLAYCVPLTWMLHGFRAITVKGLGWTAVAPDICYLGIMAIVYYTLAHLLLIKYRTLPFRQMIGAMLLKKLEYKPELPTDTQGSGINS